MSVVEQLTTDPAGFITVTNFSITPDIEEDTTPRQEEVRLIEESAADDDDDGMMK